MKPVPKQIKAKDNLLSIVWSDGHLGSYETRNLRLACRCAGCVDEWTHEPRLNPAEVSPDIRPRKIEVAGNYAVQFHWSDGHSTGLYLYDYLRELCECPVCSGTRQFSV